MCRKGVGANFILCTGCHLWVPKGCSGVHAHLTGIICPRCRGGARPIDCRPISVVSTLDVVHEFCYLCNNFSVGGGCTQAIIARGLVAWGKFKRLLTIFICTRLSLQVRGRVYNTYVRSALLHGSMDTHSA